MIQAAHVCPPARETMGAGQNPGRAALTPLLLLWGHDMDHPDYSFVPLRKVVLFEPQTSVSELSESPIFRHRWGITAAKRETSGDKSGPGEPIWFKERALWPIGHRGRWSRQLKQDDWQPLFSFHTITAARERTTNVQEWRTSRWTP